MILLYLVVAVAWLLVAVVLAAGVAALFRRWSLVVRLARVPVVGGICVLAMIVALAGFTFVEPQFLVSLLPASVGPSERARALAEFISGLMNCGALALLSAAASAVLWAFASSLGRAQAGKDP